MTDQGQERPTVPDVLPLVWAVYARHSAGCCLHILTDDYNCDNDDAAFCLERAVERGHGDCEAAARALVQMSKTQRLKVAHGR